MRIPILSSALALLTACAANETAYRVEGSSIEQPRVQAESALADRLKQRAYGEHLDKPLRVLKSPFPEFPAGLRNDSSVGSVRVRFVVEPDGTVSNPTVLGSPPPHMAAITLHAIMRWQFEPPIQAGKPTRVTLEQEFVFKLR